MTGASNTNKGIKKRIVETVKEFIRTPGKKDFQGTFRINSFLGWFGLPFFYFGITGLIYWPVGVFKYFCSPKAAKQK